MSPVSRRLEFSIRALALVLIGAHLAAPMLRMAEAWGLWPAAYLPPGWRWVLGLSAAGLVLAGDRLSRWLAPGLGLLSRAAFGSPWGRLLLAALAGVPFYLFRIRHLRWGDAELLVKALGDPYRIAYVWQAPLDVFLHAKGWVLANRLFGWPDPTPVYWVLSTAAGVAFVWMLLGLARWLGRDDAERGAIVGPVLTLGTMQLFFGYVENYPIMTLGVLAYAWLALRALRGETATVWPAAVLAVTHAFHPSTLVLAPSLLYVAAARAWPVRESGPEAAPRTPAARRPWVSELLGIAVPYCVVFAGVVALMSAGNHGLDALAGVDYPGGADRLWFVPLLRVTTAWQHYTMFSPAHLLDIVNQQLLSAPAIWPALVLAAALAWRRLPRHDRELRALFMMSAFYLLLTMVWNPDYGGQKDWDLFTPAAVPAALLLGWLLPRVLIERPALRAATWALAAAQAFHTVAWIYQNTLPAAR